MALITASNVSKVYQSGSEGEVRALDAVNLTIDEGEFVAITGPSGSGKSTLLSVLGVLSPPSSGEVTIDGIDVFGLSQERQADFRAEYIGFVFQQFQLLPFLTAAENVMLPLAITRRTRGEQREMAEAVLEKVGLEHKGNRLPNQLSGGEQERVAIARAVVNQPPIVFADEPTGNLDSGTGEEIMALFKALNREGLAVVMVTHNKESLSHVDRILSIKDGRILG